MADGRAISGPGEYTFYVDNLPVMIVVPPGGQNGDLARINIQRFNKSHPNANTLLQTGYYLQIGFSTPAAGQHPVTPST